MQPINDITGHNDLKDPAHFNDVSHFHLKIEPTLLRQRDLFSAKTLEISGTSSPLALAHLLEHSALELFHNYAHLIITSSEAEAKSFQASLDFYNPKRKASVLSGFDVSPYSALYPAPHLMAQRMQWLDRAQNARGGEIFVAPIQFLLQKTLPFSVFSQNRRNIRLNDELNPDFFKFLDSIGYRSVQVVEDPGTYAFRGGILDLFSPALINPVRLELFGDQIDSIREFNAATQRSLAELKQFSIIPPREFFYTDENRQKVAQHFSASIDQRPVLHAEAQQILRSIAQGHYFMGCEFLMPLFYEALEQPIQYFSQPLFIWRLDSIELPRHMDHFLSSLKSEFQQAEENLIRLAPTDYYDNYDNFHEPEDCINSLLSKVEFYDESATETSTNIKYRTASVDEFKTQCHALKNNAEQLKVYVSNKFNEWQDADYNVLIAGGNKSQSQRLQLVLERSGFPSEIFSEDFYDWESIQSLNPGSPIPIIPRHLDEGIRFTEEKLIVLRDEDFFGKKRAISSNKEVASLQKRTQALSFGELNPGDLVVHSQHGVALYEGLKVMPIGGIDAEFIQLKYKDGDKLYLPIYRIAQLQKYSGPNSTKLLDKLGGQAWIKTKTKVKKQLRDVASELLKLYAQRQQLERPPYSPPDEDFTLFEGGFPYEETNDQLKAINDIVSDLCSDKPMDRLICGDVGFGKTEVAMRAAFKAVQESKQVAIIAPTTVLTFQHFNNLKKRFKGWPVNIKALNRFIEKKDIKQTLQELKEGKVDIVVGTHRLFSKDVQFARLGLLVIDEEQKFGVKHKEKIRKLMVGVDTLAMSATPIPRTLNMSLVGVRDLSLITTAPQDRLPTRTFVCKFDRDTIRKAIMSEIDRGGQVFFLHNRVQSIYAVADELRKIVPEARMQVAHGQMEEHQLEEAMVKFFNQEVDVLVCTTIIESGMDIPRANTMFIDNAHQLGLSQLYQLRGRVGRSKERAYCYLLIPNNKMLDKEAQERLRIIQEHTALGSGIQIAQHDLELRGAGDMLGVDQSGHINAVGYELYMELLEDAIRAEKGLPEKENEIEPEINVRIPALIPDKYIPDIRARLTYYKAMANIERPEDLDEIEDELRDQFGKLPDEVINLMGLMLVRKMCKDLGIKDLSSGKNRISLMFSETTSLPTKKVVELTMRENKKFAVTPDHRLNIRMNEITWPRIYDELDYLHKLI